MELQTKLPEHFSEKERRLLEARLKTLQGGAASNVADLQGLLELLEEEKKREDFNGFTKWFDPLNPFRYGNLPKHKALFDATKHYREVLMLGGNRCGKTRAGATFLSVIATGLYPDDWEGIVFDGPTSSWAAGKTGQSTRDTVQEALLGPIGSWGTGSIPKDRIVRTTARVGIPNAVDTIEVLHVSGKISTIGLKSFDQKPSSFYGTAKHGIWLDEPCPDLVYNECLIRTMTTGGRLVHTITPKEGLTRLLSEFLSKCDLLAGAQRVKGLDAMMQLQEMEDRKYGREVVSTKPGVNSRACVQIGWADAPWLDEDAQNEIISSTPPFQREAVKYGTPSLGIGAVYPIPLDEITISAQDAAKLHPLPAYWRYIYGFDVGWNKTAAIFLAHDIDNDIVYVVDEYYQGQREPELHAMHIKARGGDWQIGVIDPASAGSNQMDGDKLIRVYRSHPISLRIREADNAVEAGIAKVWSRLSSGKLKFFPNTFNLQNEYLLYRRDENGRVVKENDHALDALRYAINSLQYAQPKKVNTLPIQNTKKYNV